MVDDNLTEPFPEIERGHAINTINNAMPVPSEKDVVMLLYPVASDKMLNISLIFRDL